MKKTSFMKKLFAAAVSVLCLSVMLGISLKPGADLMQTPGICRKRNCCRPAR